MVFSIMGLTGILSLIVVGPLESSRSLISGMLSVWNFLRIDSASFFVSVFVSLSPADES